MLHHPEWVESNRIGLHHDVSLEASPNCKLVVGAEISTYTKLIVYFMIRLIGRMPFAPTQTKSACRDWRN